MSETRKNYLPDKTVSQLKFLSKNIGKLNVGNKRSELWIYSDGGGGYEWDQIDVGIDGKGNLVTCFQSGCSCNGPEEPTPDTTIHLENGMYVETESYYDSGNNIDGLIEIAETLFNVLKKKKISAEKVIAIPNLEIRRAAIEFIGMEVFIRNANPIIVDTDEKHGELLCLKLKGDEDIMLVHVKDPSTDREYFLRVPPTIKNAAQARAWTFGFNEKDFVLIKET